MRGLFREMVVGRRHHDDAHDRQMSLAWHIEAFHRQKRLPDLKTVLTPKPVPKQTPNQMVGVLQQISQVYKLTLRTAPPKEAHP